MIKRFINDTYLQLRLYSLVFILFVIIFGIFGISRAVNVIPKKLALLSEMNATDKIIKDKTSNLVSSKPLIEKAVPLIPYLSTYMPDSLNIQTYLLDFVSAASAAGYSVKYFAPDIGVQKNGYMITTTLEGSGDPSLLISAIEGIKRVTTINSFSLTRDPTKGQDVVGMSIVIYSMEVK